MLLCFLCGCKGGNTTLVLHTGFAKDEVFRVGNISCTIPEVMVYLTATQNRYEAVYGKQIWEASLEEITLEESVKDMVLAQLSQIKAMNLLARQEQIELNKEEQLLVEEATDIFYNSLSKEEIKLLQIDKELVKKMYEEYAIANKVYDYLIKDVKPEVSDDEARTITVSHILIKTYSLDEENRKVEFSPKEKQKAYHRAVEILEKAREGENFETLTVAYNEDSQSLYSFRKGEMNPKFESASFHLGKDEISDIVETEYGYHIIKCISTFNQEEIDANKVKIIEKKREEIFEKQYSDFTKELTSMLNEKVWREIKLFEENTENVIGFFDIYKEYVGNSLSLQWEE